MLNKTLGILNFEASNVSVQGIDTYRPVSAASILGRYRVIDFMLANFTNSKINEIDVFLKDRPRSLVEHISGTHYNINSKRGRITLLHGEKPVHNELYNTDIASFDANMSYIDIVRAEYIIIAPSHFIYIQDFRELLNNHIESDADITILCQNVNNANEEFAMCDTLVVDMDRHVLGFEKNHLKNKRKCISLECYVMRKSLFTELVKQARETSDIYWLNDIIADRAGNLNIHAFIHKGYVACINTLKAYYNTNMALRESSKLYEIANLDWPIYTRTNDSCPTLYKEGASVRESLVGNGCCIEGEVDGSVLGRNVTIKKGSKLKDCIVFPGAVIDKGIYLENVIIDRFAVVSRKSEIKGTKEEPMYIGKGAHI